MLAETHPGTIRGPRITVGHIGGGFLAVHHDAAYAQRFHFRQCVEQDRWNKKHMRDPGLLQGFRQITCTGFFCHCFTFAEQKCR